MKTGASQDYLVQDGALRAVGPPHRISMNHTHVELKTDVSVPDVRVEADFDDVRLYPSPARHPVTVVVDSPLDQKRQGARGLYPADVWVVSLPPGLKNT